MSDFEHRLWQQLEAAAERQARGAALVRAPVLRRPRGRRALVWLLAVPAALLVLALLALAGTLRHPPPPAEPAPAPIRLHVATGLGAAAAGDGAVWLHSPQDGVLLRMDPAQRRVTGRIAAGGPQPDVAIATGPGAVWAVSVRAAGHSSQPAPQARTLLRIDPRSTRVVARIPLRVAGAPPIEPAGVTLVGDAVWVWGPDGAVRVDPQSDRAVLGIPVANVSHFCVGDICGPKAAKGDVRGFAVHGGSVWMATESGQLERFDARTGARTGRLAIPPVSGQRPVIALDDVVVLDRRDGTMMGLDPGTGRQRWRTRVGVGVSAAHLAGDVLWITASDPGGGGDRLLGLDPHSGRIATRIALPSGRTQAIAVVGRDVWVTTAAGDVLVVRP
jgi:PQQ-like domain